MNERDWKQTPRIAARSSVRRAGRDARCATLRASSWKSLLFDLWFAPYRRFKQNDSSGFEHVFVGEESRGKITGLAFGVRICQRPARGF